MGKGGWDKKGCGDKPTSNFQLVSLHHHVGIK